MDISVIVRLLFAIMVLHHCNTHRQIEAAGKYNMDA